jgi:hypothetical protein
MITPSEERQTVWATTPSSLRIKRPVLIEWKRTSVVSEQETTIPRSELTQQLRISLWCPWSTCIGPSIRCLRFFSIKWDEELLLDDGWVPLPVEDSDMTFEWDASAVCILQSNIVVSRDPVTRYLLSGERPRQVTGAQCAWAVSKVLAPSDDITLILLSACPPNQKSNFRLETKYLASTISNYWKFSASF